MEKDCEWNDEDEDADDKVHHFSSTSSKMVSLQKAEKLLERTRQSTCYGFTQSRGVSRTNTKVCNGEETGRGVFQENRETKKRIAKKTKKKKKK